MTRRGICATSEQLDTPGALQEEEQVQGGRWSLIPRCPGLGELEGKQIRQPYLPGLRPILSSWALDLLAQVPILVAADEILGKDALCT